MREQGEWKGWRRCWSFPVSWTSEKWKPYLLSQPLGGLSRKVNWPASPGGRMTASLLLAKGYPSAHSTSSFSLTSLWWPKRKGEGQFGCEYSHLGGMASIQELSMGIHIWMLHFSENTNDCLNTVKYKEFQFRYEWSSKVFMIAFINIIFEKYLASNSVDLCTEVGHICHMGDRSLRMSRQPFTCLLLGQYQIHTGHIEWV